MRAKKPRLRETPRELERLRESARPDQLSRAFITSRSALALILLVLAACARPTKSDRDARPTEAANAGRSANGGSPAGAKPATRTAPEPRAEVSVDGVWKRDDGPAYRLVADGHLVGYRVDAGEFGCRLDLTKEGSRFRGTAHFSRSRDEGAYFENALELALEADGSLRGKVEVAELDAAGKVVKRTTEEHGFTRTAVLTPAEAKDLRTAMRAHLAADAELKKDDVVGASGKLTMAMLSSSEFRSSPEFAVLKARKEALERRRSEIESVWQKGKENVAVGKELLTRGDFAGSKARWVELLKTWPRDKSYQALNELCDIGLRADPLAAKGDAAGISALADDAFARSDQKDLEEPGFAVMANLYAKCMVAAPGEPRYAFDRSVSLCHAHLWDEAHAALAAIVAKDAAAKSKNGVLAIDNLKRLDEARDRWPVWQSLDERRRELARDHGESDARFKAADADCEAERRRIRSALEVFSEYFVRVYRGK